MSCRTDQTIQTHVKQNSFHKYRLREATALAVLSGVARIFRSADCTHTAIYRCSSAVIKRKARSGTRIKEGS